MSFPKSGSITSGQIRSTIYDSSSGSVSLASAPVRHVAEKDFGNVAYLDLRGKAWRQGNLSPLPVGKDPRYTGYYSTGSSITGSGGTWTCRLLQNEFYNGEFKGAMEANSYFKCGQPGVIHEFSGGMSVSIQYTSVSQERYGALYIFGYSSGYLSGSRVQYAEEKLAGNGYRNITKTFTPSASYPYIVINFNAWGDGKNTVVSGQEIDITATLEYAKVFVR